jgi:acyl-CoA dehydrogenase
MHFGLSEEQQMIVDTVRSFVENEIYPYEDEVEKTGEVPKAVGQAIMEKTKELGFYACNFPEVSWWGRPQSSGVCASRA